MVRLCAQGDILVERVDDAEVSGDVIESVTFRASNFVPELRWATISWMSRWISPMLSFISAAPSIVMPVCGGKARFPWQHARNFQICF
jgi:hypothetical protein